MIDFDTRVASWQLANSILVEMNERERERGVVAFMDNGGGVDSFG